MGEISAATGRQVGVLVSRSGEIEHVVVGDATKLMLPDLGRMRAAHGRFRGLRLVHTHMTQEGLTRDDLVDLTRLRLDLVVAICLSPDGQPITVHYGHNVPSIDPRTPPYRTVGPIPYGKALSAEEGASPAEILSELEDAFARAARTQAVAGKDGRAILLHVTDRAHAAHAEDSLRELEDLARTAGVAVVDRILQVRDAIDPKFVMGRGKLDEVVLRSMALDASVLIFDRNLSPSQAAAVAAITDMKVIDRSQLILDIFAQRAESRDGKLQVELAQMKYLLPRIGQKDDSLSRLTGGIGGRGPGETVLEIGKRRAREKISRLENELRHLAVQRKQRRQRRRRQDIPIVSIVGYTNAGKSTLLNALTDSATLTQDVLFATLDTRSRRIRFPHEREVVITDTVGFIRDLPKDLFAAFRATFEEAEDADLLLHVVDASDTAMTDHIKTTEKLLGELGLMHKPTLLVLNKCDRLEPLEAARLAWERDGVSVSAVDRSTLRTLLERMAEHLFDGRRDALLTHTQDVAAPRDTAIEELIDDAEDQESAVAS
jgi:GTP-binding protein HflX